MSSMLLINNVTRTYPRMPGKPHLGLIPALIDVSLTLEKGRTLALVGASGAGKSTLARIVGGLEKPDRGDILVDGKSLVGDQWDRTFRKRIQMIFQDPYGSVNPFMTVAELIGEPLHIHRVCSGEKRKEVIAGLMHRVGLEPGLAGRKPEQVSGGELQRACIARAMALDPDLLVADEPVASLDAPLRAGILGLLRNIQRTRNLTMLLVAHDLQMVDHVSDEIAVMLKGRVVETGPTAAVLGDPMHPYTKLLKEVMTPGKIVDVLPDEGAAQSCEDARCPFRDRCPESMPSCDRLPPPVKKNENRTVTCFLIK